MAVKNYRYEDFPVRFLPLGPLLGLLIAILLKEKSIIYSPVSVEFDIFIEQFKCLASFRLLCGIKWGKY